MRRDRRKLIRWALHYHAPLSDAQLCWLMEHFGLKPSATRHLRYEMTRRGEVRFARRVIATARGRVQKLWELAPDWKPRRKIPF